MKTSYSLSDYKKAEKTVARRDEKTCEVCLKECKDKNAKEKHIVAIHSQQAQKYACSICPKSYSSLSSLSYHAKKHSDQTTTKQKHACDQCGKQLATEASLDRHKLSIHKAEKEMCLHMAFAYFSQYILQYFVGVHLKWRKINTIGHIFLEVTF